MKKLWVWILIFGFLSPCLALNNPEQKIDNVIRSYVIARYPDWSGLEIKISFKNADKIFKSLSALDEKTEFKVAEAYQDLKPVGNVIVPIEYSAGEKTEKVFIRAKVEVIKDVVMASRAIKRGAIIDEQDLKLEKRDVCTVPQNYFERSEQILFTEAKTNIPKNSLIYEWMIKEVPLFHRGEEVTIQIGLDNLSIKSVGVALEDGYPGKPIRIKRKGSDKILDGTVLSSRVVEVKIK